MRAAWRKFRRGERTKEYPIPNKFKAAVRAEGEL